MTTNEPGDRFIPLLPIEIAQEVIGKHGGNLTSWLVEQVIALKEQVIALRKRINILEDRDL